jgi:hypothetical protein
MAGALGCGRTERCTRVNSLMASIMELVSIIGRMQSNILVNFLTARSMVLVSGKYIFTLF